MCNLKNKNGLFFLKNNYIISLEGKNNLIIYEYNARLPESNNKVVFFK